MIRIPRALAVASFALTPLVAAVPQAAVAQAAQPADAKAFVQDLADRAFGVLRDRSLSDAERKRRFREMLTGNFAIDLIGDRLIRSHRDQITPQQYAAYKAAFPGFVVGAYADRLDAYGDAQLRVTRSLPRNGGEDVFARVTQPGKGPIDTIWAVRRVGDRWLISNLTVSGVNLELTQEADFNAYIQRNGFDALVQFMRKSQA